MKKSGHLLITTDSGTIERDTQTCAHCQHVVIITPARPLEECGGWCHHCSKCICTACAKDGRCTPFEKKLDAFEKRQITLRSMGL